LGEFGVNRLFLAAAAKTAGRPVLSEVRVVAVSYTHLTLPTICSV